jgi:pyridoxamine 5'-phosphate oxidase
MTDEELNEDTVARDPYEQFRRWWAHAQEHSGMLEPTGMTLATVGPDGQPSARIVLLKHWDARGFVFFSNYLSRKGMALEHEPRAALLMWWDKLRRQVRIEGRAERLGAKESDDYFADRPRGAQIGAWASRQSRPLDSRETLAGQMRELEQEFGKGPIPRPPHWGGYRLVPEWFEFWDDGEHRLHDRLCFRRNGSVWDLSRVYP